MKSKYRPYLPQIRLKTVLSICALLACCLMPAVLHSQELKVLVSIKPLALLIAPLLGDKPQRPSSVDILLPANASPHRYALKVSNRNQLSEADLVVWVGPGMERFLLKPIGSLDSEKTLAAMSVGLMNWPESANGPSAEHDHHGMHDPHFWLDPQNAVVLLEAVAQRLQVLNPAQHLIYQRRLENMVAKIRESESKIIEILGKVKNQPFVISHDGFGHFVARFGLNQLAAIRLNVDSKPGARHLYALRKNIVEEKVRCVFVEPGETKGWGVRLAEELNLRAVSLDTLAVEVEGIGYTGFIEGLAQTVEGCLSGEG